MMQRVFILRSAPQARQLWAFLKANWLSVADFTAYMDRIEAYATSELGIELGVPQ
jgi:hypothetical protein